MRAEMNIRAKVEAHSARATPFSRLEQATHQEEVARLKVNEMDFVLILVYRLPYFFSKYVCKSRFSEVHG